jgi:hypothetical protein
LEEAVPNMAPKITSSNTTRLFLLGLYEEYHLSGENSSSSKSATLHNETTATVTEVMFVNTWHEIKYHFDMCQATNGAYIGTY